MMCASNRDRMLYFKVGWQNHLCIEGEEFTRNTVSCPVETSAFLGAHLFPQENVFHLDSTKERHLHRSGREEKEKPLFSGSSYGQKSRHSRWDGWRGMLPTAFGCSETPPVGSTGGWDQWQRLPCDLCTFWFPERDPNRHPSCSILRVVKASDSLC